MGQTGEVSSKWKFRFTPVIITGGANEQQRYNSDKVDSTTFVGLAISRGSSILKTRNESAGDHYVGGGRDLYLGRASSPPPRRNVTCIGEYNSGHQIRELSVSIVIVVSVGSLPIPNDGNVTSVQSNSLRVSLHHCESLFCFDATSRVQRAPSHMFSELQRLMGISKVADPHEELVQFIGSTGTEHRHVE